MNLLGLILTISTTSDVIPSIGITMLVAKGNGQRQLSAMWVRSIVGARLVATIRLDLVGAGLVVMGGLS